MQDENYAFIFRDQSIVPIDIVGSVYQGNDTVLVNGISDTALLWAINQILWDSVGISTRTENDKVLAMMEYESSSDQNPETQIQHQIRLEEDWTTIKFDDYDVLWYNTVLGLWSYGLNVSSSLGWNILSLNREWLLSLKNYSFPIEDWQPNQVLSTNGEGILSWVDVSGGWGGWAGVSSLNGQIGDLWLTSDDIEQGEENQFLVTKRITLSAEQILNLHTNPLPALPAPWNNKIITVLDIFARFNPWATAYTPSGFPNVAVYYQDQDPGSALKTNYDFLENTTEFVQKLSPGCFGNCATDMNNKGMFIWYEAGASVSGGDGTVDLYISYKILDLNMPITE